MTSPTFFRWGGVAILVGSLVFAISLVITLFVPGPLGPSGPPAVWDAWLGAISGIIWLIGLPALYTVQSKSAGLIGLLGFIGLFLGILLLAVVSFIIPAIVFANYTGPAPSAMTQPPLAVMIIFIVGSLFLVAGAILFGIATLRTKVFASWTIWALMVLAVISTILFFVPPIPVLAVLGTIVTVLFLLIFTWYGYQLAFQTGTFVEVVASDA